MHYQELLDLILADAKRKGFTDPETGQVDAVECELDLRRVLMELSEDHDLDAFTVINPAIFVTLAGRDNYPLPEDFGRMLHPRDDDESGFLINDGSNDASLRYVAPREFQRNKSTTNGKPGTFTIAGNFIRLDPPPDSNSSSNYTGKATYIRQIEDIDLDENVPFVHHIALIDGTLARLAEGFGSPALQMLEGRAARSRMSLINHQARIRQPFQRGTARRLGRSVR